MPSGLQSHPYILSTDQARRSSWSQPQNWAKPQLDPLANPASHFTYVQSSQHAQRGWGSQRSSPSKYSPAQNPLQHQGNSHTDGLPVTSPQQPGGSQLDGAAGYSPQQGWLSSDSAGQSGYVGSLQHTSQQQAQQQGQQGRAALEAIPSLRAAAEAASTSEQPAQAKPGLQPLSASKRRLDTSSSLRSSNASLPRQSADSLRVKRGVQQLPAVQQRSAQPAESESGSESELESGSETGSDSEPGAQPVQQVVQRPNPDAVRSTTSSQLSARQSGSLRSTRSTEDEQSAGLQQQTAKQQSSSRVPATAETPSDKTGAKPVGNVQQPQVQKKRWNVFAK